MTLSKSCANARPNKRVSLKMLADYVGLATPTVCLVINRSPAADRIPEPTKNLIFEAAHKLHYRPNLYARSLSSPRSCTIGVMVPDVSEDNAAMLLSGIEDYLLKRGYLCLVASHRYCDDLMDEHSQLLIDRCVDGIIGVDTPWNQTPSMPVATVSCRGVGRNVTNVRLDHDLAAQLVLQHLYELGHRKLAFIKGYGFSSDTELRWKAIRSSAQRLGLPISRDCVGQLLGDRSICIAGYQATRRLLSTGEPFTALFTFNDIAAIAAIRAIREAGLQVPGDISVVGFDDIASASFQDPSLTAVRQPFMEMGMLAAETVLRQISHDNSVFPPRSIVVKSELMVRGSTAPMRIRKIISASRRRRSA
jgi:DNA-binding LacI/PurR family transcriptional regulator